tara:strand:+ start:799 stop:2004 length:1206 start_codon:yes stop_codon:yes gene_type:complete
MAIKHILIIEDDSFHAAVLKKILTTLTDAIVRICGNGLEALDYVTRQEPDIIFCDLNMPSMDGVEFLRRLSGISIQPYIVITSGMTNDVLHSVMDMAKSYGLKHVFKLPKPVSREALCNLLTLQIKHSQQQSQHHTSRVDISPSEVRNALLLDTFEPFFQGHYCACSGELVGAEALVRWNHPSYGFLTPDKFLPSILEQNLSYALSCQMLRSSLEVAAKWHRLGKKIQIAINVSPSDIEREDFADKVFQAVEEARFPANKLTLEVTEAQITSDLAKTLENMSRLRMRGITISIDDFGTGFSSISQLINSPFSELKIDQSFVSRMSDSPKHFAALKCMVNLGKSLDLKLVAEGIETQSQAKMMSKLGCHTLQGYLFNKPMSSQEFLRLCIMPLCQTSLNPTS